MPRSRRRRANDRRRAHEQKVLAAETLRKAREVESHHLSRGVKSVFRHHAGEVIEAPGDRRYLVEEDGSLERVRKEG